MLKNRKMTKVAVILINYHDYAEKFLAQCWQSLLNLNFPNDEREIIIVDNGSTPQTRQTLLKMAPTAHLIFNEQNPGFGGGNNLGIKKAVELGCEYFYLLNMDTTVDPDFLTQALAIYQSDPSIGIVQSRLMLFEKPDLLNSLGNAVHFLGFGYCQGYEKSLPKNLPTKLEIPYASGAGLLISRTVYEKIGPFTEDFFMYHDDLEWGIKARLQGYINVVATRSIVYHKYEFSRSIEKYYWMERNRILLWLMTLKYWTLILILPIFIVTEIGLLLLGLKNGWFNKKIKAYQWFFDTNNWKKVKIWRAQIQNTRKISDRQLCQSFTARLTDYKFSVSGTLTFFANLIFQIYWSIIKLLIV